MALFGFGKNAGPHPPKPLGGGAVAVVSSFGLDHTQLGPEFPAHQILNSGRSLELEYRSKFFKCTQHDWKAFDWNGAMRRPERHPTQPLIGNSMPEMYVPLDQRRPSSPYRLGRTIVNAFTTLTFGYGRWPSILSDDPATQDFAEALVKACKLKTKMIRARNLGGACGTVGMSWGFNDGKPRVRIHEARHLYAEEWDDEDELIPSHIIELYQYPKDVWNEKKGKHERKFFWHRCDWTMEADIAFVPVEVTKDNPMWQIDEEKSVMHNDGVCHFVWIRNLPDDEVDSIDGQCDYAETYEQLNTVDILNSCNSSGTAKNLDPTLVLAMEQEDLAGSVLKKGSDNALAVGPNGSASYLEISGAAANAGHTAIDKQREQVMEVCQCIVPDPNEVAGGATSSVALKIVYAPMLSKGDIMRDQYGEAIVQILEGMITAARNKNIGQVTHEPTVDDEGYELVDEVTQEPILTPVENTLNLPPRIEKIELTDEEGNPTGEFRVELHTRVPGSGSLTLEWPDYFEPTSDDIQKRVTSFVTATGGKAVISQQTAVENIATEMHRDPDEEYSRLRAEQEQDRKQQAAMFMSPGGPVDDPNALPDGAEPLEGEDEEDDDGEAGPATAP